MAEEKGQEVFNFDFEPIKGYPELRWAGKRPFTGTSYYPAQLKESYGKASEDGWMNKLYWGDNLQVMSHLLKKYRGKVNLIYIDPPFDSKADYKKTIKLRTTKQEVSSGYNTFEEKQYGDIWLNDEYLQFIYERLMLCRELLAPTGTIYLHCDWHRSHYLRLLMDEIFGNGGAEGLNPGFKNEIIWKCTNSPKAQSCQLGSQHNSIFLYTKTNKFTFNRIYKELDEQALKAYGHEDERGKFQTVATVAAGIQNYEGRKQFEFMGVTAPYLYTIENMKKFQEDGLLYQASPTSAPRLKKYLNDSEGSLVSDIWADKDVSPIQSSEGLGYPTQKPEALLERIIKASSNPGDIVFDCFMGSGTTQAVAMKLGRRFLGADINLGAVQTTTKRLINRAKELNSELGAEEKYTGFEVYNVNDYDFFRNELEAKKLIIEALGMQALPENNLYDAELDGRMVSILGINRIATASEFEKIVANIDVAQWQKKQAENPAKPVEKITFVCMGHDPELKAMFEQKMDSMGFKVDVEILDILRDKKDLTFKRDSDAKIIIKDGKLKIDQFYPMNLLQKLSLESQDVEDWKELVDSVMIDWNYDGVTFSPDQNTGTDIPEKNQLVKGEYKIPSDAGSIHIKITDLISESWEGTFTCDGEKL